MLATYVAKFKKRRRARADSPLPTQVAPLKPLPEALQLHAGGRGQSCTAACAAHNLTCDSAGFQYLNDCDRLRGTFPCEAGCAVGQEQPEAPSYIAYGSPKAHYPTMCWTLPREEGPGCDTTMDHAVRLCPCTEAARADEQ